ncbi:hypothetical protein HPP92_029078 [Vanilla planifolia]|uniref:Uncharacterized protein n=1 Tax=Vanilla planifolia TaxID=51239 RepID=A0A835P652_VANPL|nr:hypothetical protein HPP92_029067 [Vanilla planifolia]KAG0445967.1 hypothetical protein HPP92_029078 [Vanilla planifolia]
MGGKSCSRGHMLSVVDGRALRERAPARSAARGAARLGRSDAQSDPGKGGMVRRLRHHVHGAHLTTQDVCDAEEGFRRWRSVDDAEKGFPIVPPP